EAELRQTTREVQMVTALQNALILKPDLVDAHLLLAQIYYQIHYWDTSLHHWEQAVKYMKEKPPSRLPSESAEDYQRRMELFDNHLKGMRKDLKALAREVARRSKDFRLQSADKRLQEKVMIAIQFEYAIEAERRRDSLGRGLASKALDLLLKAK